MAGEIFDSTLQFSAPGSVQRFRRFFGRYGIGMFDYMQLPEGLRALYSLPQEVGYKMLEAFCKRVEQPEMLGNCVVAFIDIDYFQAYAVEDEGFYYVAISAAVPALIQALYNNILEYTNPFSPVVKADEETEYYTFPTRLAEGRVGGRDLFAAIEKLVTETLPDEKWQRVLAVKLAELAVTFCMAHEIGHVVSGHAFLAGKRQSLGMAERLDQLELASERKIGSRVSQAWEIEADRVGIALLYSYVIGTARPRQKFMHYLRCKTKPELYGRVIHAVYMVFLIIGQQDEVLRTARSHPAAVTRFTFLMSFLGTLLADQEGHSSEEAASVMEQHADMAEAAWQNLGFSAERPDSIDELVAVVTEMGRARDLCNSFYGKYSWAVLLRS